VPAESFPPHQAVSKLTFAQLRRSSEALSAQPRSRNALMGVAGNSVGQLAEADELVND
jgi:hypothetical protein